MYLITFDLDTQGLVDTSIYSEVRKLLERLGFEHIQESVYLLEDDDYGIVQKAIDDLRDSDDFKECVKDVRLFEVAEQYDLIEEIQGNTDLLR